MNLLKKVGVSIFLAISCCLSTMAYETITLPQNATSLTDPTIEHEFYASGDASDERRYVGISGVNAHKKMIKNIIPQYYEKDITILANVNFIKFEDAAEWKYDHPEFGFYEDNTVNHIIFHSVIINNTVCVDLSLLTELMNTLGSKLRCTFEDRDFVDGFEYALVNHYASSINDYNYIITFIIGHSTSSKFAGDDGALISPLSVAPFYYSHINETSVNYVDGRFYVPMKDFVELFGGTVTYDAELDCYKLSI